MATQQYLYLNFREFIKHRECLRSKWVILSLGDHFCMTKSVFYHLFFWKLQYANSIYNKIIWLFDEDFFTLVTQTTTPTCWCKKIVHTGDIYVFQKKGFMRLQNSQANSRTWTPTQVLAVGKLKWRRCLSCGECVHLGLQWDRTGRELRSTSPRPGGGQTVWRWQEERRLCQHQSEFLPRQRSYSGSVERKSKQLLFHC